MERLLAGGMQVAQSDLHLQMGEFISADFLSEM